MREIVLIAHNLRSCHNVGSLLRTAEGLGLTSVYLTGYTPYPIAQDDERMPHIREKVARRIHKTALGAEHSQAWQHIPNVNTVISSLKSQGYMLAAIEQSPTAIPLQTFVAPEKIALLVGREVEGVEDEVLVAMDSILEIPMYGSKESFNVVQAAAMGMYQCRFMLP
jgi:23S rRNA (guanosine2251-2'-O)-methyltransferase